MQKRKIIVEICMMIYLGLFSVQGAKCQRKTIQVWIDLANTAQTIDNLGASGAWFSEPVGRFWADSIKSRMAELLFSRDFDKKGNPKGIGLSSWRFNIGGGSEEQGDSSGIKDRWRRVESFLLPNGSYNWSKQQGYLWFTRQAKKYGVENLIAFSNTPPVFFTKNGLGFKTEKDYVNNLQPSKYTNYACFLTEVLLHFEKEGLRFKYISPVNEPQWDWSHSYGEGAQEGTPWTNGEITQVVKDLDSCILKAGVHSQILITEAAQLQYLYEKPGKSGEQISALFASDMPLSVKGQSQVLPVIGGHSYFSDSGDSARISVRKHVADTAAHYRLGFWQTEYSMLGDGYKEGQSHRIPTMDCALFLAKVIHDDIVYGQAKAWQFWNSWEPGSPALDTRYCLIALRPAKDWMSGSFAMTKNLWSLGHYSRFIRPGMVRLRIKIQDGLTEIQRAQNVMLSSFVDQKQDSLVVVAINYSNTPQKVSFRLPHALISTSAKVYLTTEGSSMNMRLISNGLKKNNIILPSRSISTIVWFKNSKKSILYAKE